MTEENTTVSGEIEGYIKDLHKTRHSLCNFQMKCMNNASLTSEAEGVVSTIDKLMDRLNVPNLSETVDLDTIVTLSSDVSDVQTSATRLLAKKVF